jgi:antibiotic biosynthesis monooxygenase (ABM) superfamily enzyme
MTTLLVFHEVDDVDHWLRSPKREEVWKPFHISGRVFHDPDGSNRVGVIVEVPDMDTFQQFIHSKQTAEAMTYDRVRPDTVLVLSEG